MAGRMDTWLGAWTVKPHITDATDYQEARPAGRPRAHTPDYYIMYSIISILDYRLSCIVSYLYRTIGYHV